jgi:hypothetical protein
MPDEAIDRIRADHDELAARERLPALEREMRAGFQSINAKVDGGFESIKADLRAVNARFDGLEAEVRFGFEKIDRMEGRFDGLESRLERIEGMLKKALNGGTDGTRGT